MADAEPRVLSRAELGRVYLPWYVYLADPGRVVERADHISAGRPVTIAEVCEDHWPDHPVLTHPHPDHGGWTHAGKIVAYVEAMRDGSESRIVRAPAERVSGGLLLLDRCHRACALYRLNPSGGRLELTLTGARA